MKHMRIKFNAKRDLDRDELYLRAEKEAKLIHSKPSTRKGRDLESIIMTTLYGHASEMYLINHQGFTDDLREYKDVIDPDGEPVEVKTTKHEKWVPYVLRRENERAKDAWREYPKLLYIFVGDVFTLDYYLHSIYEWNGKEFCLQSDEVVV